MSVVLFHATGLSGGFVGVDIFFVISGFLISRIIFREIDEGRFTIGRFYERRIRRIIPALTAVIVITALAFAFFSVPIDYKSFGQSVGATAAFFSNVFFFIKSDYFDPSSETAPLLHTWSLAVEEQYYLVFPLLAMWVGKASPARRFTWLAVGFVASFLLSVWMVRVNPSLTFYLPFTRFWELFIGAMVATLGTAGPATRLRADVAAGIGLVLLGLSIAFYTGSMLFPGESALPPCLGAALLLYAGQHPEGRVRAFLSLRPFVLIGLISYSLYLWHWPILVGIRYVLFRDMTTPEVLLALVVMMVAAYLSWRFVEQPFRHQVPGGRNRLFAVTAALGAAAFAFAIAAHVTGGFPQRFPEPARAYAASALDINPRRAECDRPAPSRIRDGQVCMIGDPNAPEASFVFFGDSFADALMPAMDETAKQQGRKGYALVHSGCFPLVGVNQNDPSCRAFTDAGFEFIRSRPKLRNVVLAARWTSALLGNRFGQFHGEGWFITDAQSSEPSYPENGRVFRRTFRETLATLKGRDVSVVAFIPEQRYDVPRALALNTLYDTPPSVPLPRALHEMRQAPLRQAFADIAADAPFRVVDIGASLCGEQSCPVVLGDTVLYVDDNHLSRAGGLALAKLFAPSL